jgi:UDP:flavonoid glycosyltransferase YjiC (YdhE family)
VARILFTSFPAYGHVHPIVPLALAAQQAGHEVRVASGRNLSGWLARCGLVAEVVGLDEDGLAEVADREFAGPLRTDHMFVDVWVGSALPQLLTLAERWRPDLVVHEEEEYAGVLLASLLGLPCVTQSWSAPARPAGGQATALELLGPVWAEYTSEPPRRTGELYLDACPPAFQTDDLVPIADAARVVGVRPGLFDGPSDADDEALPSLHRPSAYVTLGTVAVFSTPGLLATIAGAISPAFETVLLTTGPNPVASVGDLPPNVVARPYVRQSRVLPSVDVFVSHGGAGGTVAALVHGVPHLVVPGSGTSQQTLSRAVERTGIGLRVHSPDSDQIADAARTLLSDGSFGAAVRALAAELADLPSPKDVVGVLPVS